MHKLKIQDEWYWHKGSVYHKNCPDLDGEEAGMTLYDEFSMRAPAYHYIDLEIKKGKLIAEIPRHIEFYCVCEKSIKIPVKTK